jgi:hypothetical protein
LSLHVHYHICLTNVCCKAEITVACCTFTQCISHIQQGHGEGNAHRSNNQLEDDSGNDEHQHHIDNGTSGEVCVSSFITGSFFTKVDDRGKGHYRVRDPGLFQLTSMYKRKVSSLLLMLSFNV